MGSYAELLLSSALWLAPLVLVVAIVGGIVVFRATHERVTRGANGGQFGAEPLDEETALWLADKLRETDIFEGLTDQELQLVVSFGRLRSVAAGQRLARAGRRGVEIFTVLRGQLRLLTRDHGQEFSVRLAHENETVPLAALLDPPVLVTTIEAAVDSEVFSIPSERLIELCEANPMIGLEVYRAVTKSFERRYRATLHSLVTSLNIALHTAQTGTEVHTDLPV